ncbi:fructosamine kinase family protein [Vibrio sp. S17_S38]|uniref:fructosamine kinase family protein n=1 Tax=Vibrio sp. S17_S38 TaxID=2720229 RepID=UPI001680229D|nr:fructosamine kinase family protein [Vibrio sp. S17_S38]MBD1572861.1 fructosamine kinase family protein [Vibrio sp. S17_S38]
MWQAIAQQLSDATAFEFILREKEHLNDGETNYCYLIGDGEQRYFIKLNERSWLSKFEAEFENLSALNATSTLCVPEPIICGQTKEHSFLILNYYPTKSLNKESDFYTLGQQVARLHLCGDQKDFGYDADTYVGLNLQPNAWHKKWCVFFAEHRIGWQLQLLKEKGIDLGDINEVVQYVKKILANHQPKPSLLHGSLNQQNVALSPIGPLCYDPSSFWGDREYDIAIAEYYGQMNPAFMEGYQAIYPLEKNYIQRKDIYQFYYLLCLCNQYGGEYLPKCAHKIAQYLKID